MQFLQSVHGEHVFLCLKLSLNELSNHSFQNKIYKNPFTCFKTKLRLNYMYNMKSNGWNNNIKVDMVYFVAMLKLNLKCL
jgi:hypothetical protein